MQEVALALHLALLLDNSGQAVSRNDVGSDEGQEGPDEQVVIPARAYFDFRKDDRDF